MGGGEPPMEEALLLLALETGDCNGEGDSVGTAAASFPAFAICLSSSLIISSQSLKFCANCFTSASKNACSTRAASRSNGRSKRKDTPTGGSTETWEST